MSKEQLSHVKVFFPNLDGLRFIAFLMVYMQHGILNSFRALNIKGTVLEKILQVICDGGIGVSIFFVLSGFLITYLILVEIELKQKLNVKYFYIRRTLRIWPLYFAVIVFIFFIYPYIKSLIGISTITGQRPIYYFTFLSNFDIINIQKNLKGLDNMSGNVTWSVAIEEQFYLIWPLLFYIIPKRFYKFIFVGIIASSLIFRYLNTNDGTVLYFHTLGVCSDLAIGGLCAYYILYSNLKKYFITINKMKIIFIYVLAILWLFFNQYIFSFNYSNVFNRLITTLFFAFIILEQNYCINSFYKFSKSKFLSHWGKYTYGLYLLHPIAIMIMDIIFRLLHIDYKINFVLSFAVGLIGLSLSMFLSYVSYEYYELYFLKLKQKFSFIGSLNSKNRTI